MIKKFVLIAVFVSKKSILSFLGQLKEKYNINLKFVNIYQILENDEEYLVSFPSDNKDYFIKNLPNANIFHTKNKSIFSINALNQLIKDENDGEIIDSKNYQIDWEKYRNKLLTVKNGLLKVYSIIKFDDMSQFLFNKNIYNK